MNPATRSSSSFFSLRLRRAQRSTLLMAAALVALTACEEDEVTVPATAAVVDVTPRISTVTSGQTVQLAAQAKDAAGNAMSGGTVVWKSLDTLVARVSTAGLVTAVASGATAIVATTLGRSGFASVDALGITAAVVITGTQGTLPIGQSVQLAASAVEANGRPLFKPVTWTSSAPAVATVSSTGLVTSVSVGSTTISATSDGKVGTQPLTILPPPPVATVTIAPASGTYLPTGVGVPLSATMRDANGGVLSGRTVTWSSSNTAVATVSGTGVVTALTTGNVTITATSEGRSGTATYTALTGLANLVGQNFSNPTDASAFFAVYVPAGSTSLLVTLRNGNGDPDLYVYRPGQALNTAAACASEAGGAVVVENCTLTNPIAGVWVVEVFAFAAHTGTTIMATITPTPP